MPSPTKRRKSMAVFTSRNKNPSVVLDPGGKKPVDVGDGKYEYKTFEEIKIKFDNHLFDSNVYFNRDEITLLARGWTEEKICEQIRKNPRFGGEYFEVKPPTKEDKLKAAQILKAQAEELVKEAEKLGGEDVEVVVEPPKEAVTYTEKCPDCDWVAESSVSEAQMHSKLRGHRAVKHKK